MCVFYAFWLMSNSCTDNKWPLLLNISTSLAVWSKNYFHDSKYKIFHSRLYQNCENLANHIHSHLPHSQVLVDSFCLLVQWLIVSRPLSINTHFSCCCTNLQDGLIYLYIFLKHKNDFKACLELGVIKSLLQSVTLCQCI
jgi:hypothetical protein